MRELFIAVNEICKKGYKVEVQADDFYETQGIHYGVRLIVIRRTKDGIFGKRYPRAYSLTDKKVMKSVYPQWEKVRQSGELTKIEE